MQFHKVNQAGDGSNKLAILKRSHTLGTPITTKCLVLIRLVDSKPCGFIIWWLLPNKNPNTLSSTSTELLSFKKLLAKST